MNAMTNVILAIQCAVYGLHQRRERASAGALEWSMFFLLMSVATAAGVIKHGIGAASGGDVYRAVLAISNVAGGLAAYFAQCATILRHAGPGRHPILEASVFAQAVLFLCANAVLGPELALLIANTAVALLPVIVIEHRAARAGAAGSHLIASGLLVSVLAAVAYAGELSIAGAFDHIDVAHAIMAVGFHLIHCGVVPRTTLPVLAVDPCRS